MPNDEDWLVNEELRSINTWYLKGTKLVVSEVKIITIIIIIIVT